MWPSVHGGAAREDLLHCGDALARLRPAQRHERPQSCRKVRTWRMGQVPAKARITALTTVAHALPSRLPGETCPDQAEYCGQDTAADAAGEACTDEGADVEAACPHGGQPKEASQGIAAQAAANRTRDRVPERSQIDGPREIAGDVAASGARQQLDDEVEDVHRAPPFLLAQPYTGPRIGKMIGRKRGC